MNKLYIEDYFGVQYEEKPLNKSLVLVIYDITDNKRRTAFVKLLEGYGVRVQKSAFEMIIDKNGYNKLIAEIPAKITDEDNIRIYKLKINGEIVSWGSPLSEPQEVIIV